MNVTRRVFIGGVAAFVLDPSMLQAGESGSPRLRIGVMTDTHVGKTKESCSRARLACEMFRDMGVDLLVNVGDVADCHYPSGYKAYREMIEETFANVPAGLRPKELFVYAGHDANFYGGHPRSQARKYAPEAFADMQKLIGASNGPYAEGEVRGFPYVVIPEYYGRDGKVDYDRFERMLSDAEKAHPGKPVFVFAHVPPYGTTRNGRGLPGKRAVLDRHPRAINISGHVHGSLRDERAIWQGNFTSVSAGCLQNWGGDLPGNMEGRKQNFGAMLVEVFDGRVVFRRFDVRDGKEYCASSPWTIPWPFDPATAPYRPGARARASGVPQFASGAEIKIKADADPCGRIDVGFPAVAGDVRPFAYRIELQRKTGGEWRCCARQDVFGDFWQSEKERKAKIVQRFSAAYFEEGGECRVEVVPRNCWGAEGKGIVKTFTAPKNIRRGETVWESLDPMKDCAFYKGYSGERKVPVTDGFASMGGESARLMLPDGAWEGPDGARFRLVLDMRTIEEESPRLMVGLRSSRPGAVSSRKMSTPGGDCGTLRYVMELERPAAEKSYHLLFVPGGGVRVRIERIKIERMR